MTNRHEGLRADGPAVYLIQVGGRLDSKWSASMGGMNITAARSGANDIVTTLIGELQDQAALAGVLNTIYDLHMPVLSVKCLGESDS